MKSAWLVIFSVAWMALAVAGILLFCVKADARFKRKYSPWHLTLIGMLFVVSVLIEEPSLFSLIVVIPVLALFGYLMLHRFKFCLACDRTIVNRRRVAKKGRCPYCRAEFGSPQESDVID